MEAQASGTTTRWLACVGLAVLVSAPTGAAAETLGTFDHQITSSAANETTPTLGLVSSLDPGTVVIYTEIDSTGAGEILAQFILADGSPDPAGPFRISLGGTDDRLNDISGSLVVYTAFDGNSSEIRLFDILTGVTETLAAGGGFGEARISGSWVVWVQQEGQAGSTRVKFLDLTWPAGVAAVTLEFGGAASMQAVDVEIDTRFVTWTEVGGGTEVWAYDVLAGIYQGITPVSGGQASNSATFGNWVTYQTTGGLGPAIEAKNLITSQVVMAPAAGATWMANPAIDGDLVAYESNRAGNLDIHLLRLSDGAGFQVTTSPADQELNTIFGDKVAYVSHNAGQTDIFLTLFEFEVCGDGVVTSGEQCDDGNAIGGDGCEPDCTLTTFTLHTGKRIVVRDSAGDPTQRKIVVVSRDGSLGTPAPGSTGDPRTNGATLRVMNPTTGEAAEFVLPPGELWTALGNPAGSRGYKYLDRRFTNGPCRVVLMKPGRVLRTVCLGDRIPFDLDEPQQGDLTVLLQLGGEPVACMSFGGVLLRDRGTGTLSSGVGLFKKKDAPVPASCPLP